MIAPLPPARDGDGDPIYPIETYRHWYVVGLCDLETFERLAAKAVAREVEAQEWRDKHHLALPDPSKLDFFTWH